MHLPCSIHRALSAVFFATLLLLVLSVPAAALGLSGIALKGGIDLSQQEFAVSDVQIATNQFDTGRLALAGHIDLGSLLIPDLHLVPAAAVVFENDLRIFSAFVEVRYFFHRGDKTSGYAGGGLGANVLRFRNTATPVPGTEKFALSIPIGFQTRLSGSLNWIGELNVVIGEEQNDSSIRLMTGIGFGRR